jgi:hypothetical protein
MGRLLRFVTKTPSRKKVIYNPPNAKKPRFFLKETVMDNEQERLENGTETPLSESDRFRIKGDIIQRLQERWGIGRAQVFNRIKYLEISFAKDVGGYYCLHTDLEELDQLDLHLKGGRSMDEFPKRGRLATVEREGLGFENINLDDLEGDQDFAFAQLIRTAQEKAAGITIAQNLLTAKFIGNPEQLPEDLREQVERSQVALAPKSLNPLEIAGEFLRKAQTVSAVG